MTTNAEWLQLFMVTIASTARANWKIADQAHALDIDCNLDCVKDHNHEEKKTNHKNNCAVSGDSDNTDDDATRLWLEKGLRQCSDNRAYSIDCDGRPVPHMTVPSE